MRNGSGFRSVTATFLCVTSQFVDGRMFSEEIAFITVGFVGMLMFWTTYDIVEEIKEVMREVRAENQKVMREVRAENQKLLAKISESTERIASSQDRIAKSQDNIAKLLDRVTRSQE